MKTKIRRSFASLLLMSVVVVAMSRATEAALIYGLEFQGPTNIVTGSAFSLDVFLRETATELGDATVIGDPLQGVIQGNFAINRTGAGGFAITGVTGNLLFDVQGTALFSMSSASLVQGALMSTPTASQLSPNVYRLLLGTLSLTAPLVLGESNTFTFVDPSSSDDLFLGDGSVIDSAASYGSFTVTAVPESSSMILFGGLGAAYAGIAKFRRRRIQTANQPA